MTAPRIDAVPIVEFLASQWPACFTADPRERRPLKVGIHADLVTAAGGALSWREISGALRWYVHAGGYLYRMRAGAERIGLDGKPAGSVTAEEAEDARAKLKARRAKREAVEKARSVMSLQGQQ